MFTLYVHMGQFTWKQKFCCAVWLLPALCQPSHYVTLSITLGAESHLGWWKIFIATIILPTLFPYQNSLIYCMSQVSLSCLCLIQIFDQLYLFCSQGYHICCVYYKILGRNLHHSDFQMLQTF